jgi:hypothetical protein
LRECGLHFSQAIVWDKEHPVFTRKDFMGAFELAYYGWKEGAAHRYFGPNNASDLWRVKAITVRDPDVSFSSCRARREGGEVSLGVKRRMMAVQRERMACGDGLSCAGTFTVLIREEEPPKPSTR